MTPLGVLRRAIRQGWRRMTLWGLTFALLFQGIMLLALIGRFQALPNYVTFYDWIGNVAWIIRSTPSWSDIAGIVREEWLIEIGRMNYDYGAGISEWSLNVIPSRLAVLFAAGALLALCRDLARADSCSPATLHGATGLGAVLVALTNVTMSWVVCCATPTWVVGLSMLGLGVSTSLALAPLGPVLTGLGFGILVVLIFALAWRKSRSPSHPERKLAHA